MSTLFSLAVDAQRVERPFVFFAGRAGHGIDRLALGLRSVLALSAPLPAGESVTECLRAAAHEAFGGGARALVVSVTHEAAALFDRIPVHPAWTGLPGIQLWAVEEWVTAPSFPWPQTECPRLTGYGFDRASLQVRRQWHEAAIDLIRAKIIDGRVYQSCLTFPIELSPLESPGALFAWLMHAHPVDHGAWLSTPDLQLVSCSPELLFSLDNRKLLTRPMKGTRALPAAVSAEAARWVLEELQNSAKDRAENVMIADLLRNDFGRVCVPGSVQASALWTVDRLASVAQMTSTIEGELQEGRDVWDVLAAVFPPGSMTGAPKIAACELLHQLEHQARGLYGGTLGWIEPAGTASFSVLIRSLQQRAGQARWDVGGGIVADSSALAEWQEAWAKIGVLQPLWSATPELSAAES